MGVPAISHVQEQQRMLLPPVPHEVQLPETAGSWDNNLFRHNSLRPGQELVTRAKTPRTDNASSATVTGWLSPHIFPVLELSSGHFGTFKGVALKIAFLPKYSLVSPGLPSNAPAGLGSGGSIFTASSISGRAATVLSEMTHTPVTVGT